MQRVVILEGRQVIQDQRGWIVDRLSIADR